MKKSCVILCVFLVMSAMIGCKATENGSDNLPLEDSLIIESSNSADIQNMNSNNPNREIDDIMPKPEISEELFGFNADTLLLGKTYKEIKEICPDLVYTGNFLGGACFYSEIREMWVGFDYTDIQDPDNPNEKTICLTIDANAEKVFPDVGERLSKSDIEVVIGTEVNVAKNEPNYTEFEGEYIADFKYKDCWFTYLPKEEEGDIFHDTVIHVFWKPNNV